MADLTLTMEAEDKVSPVMRDVSASAKSLESAMANSKGTIARDWTKLADDLKQVGAAVIGTLGAIAKTSLDAFMQQEKADKQLSATLKQLGYDAKALTEVFKEQASQFQKNLGVSDDMVQGIQTMLLRFDVAPASVQKTTAAILDYAAATGTDAESATWALVKAVENGGHGLSRMGIAIDATGDKSKDLAAAVEALGQKFGGAAESDADSLSGRVRKAKEALSEMEEALGGMLANAEQKWHVLDKITYAFESWSFLLSQDKEQLDASVAATQELIDARDKLAAAQEKLARVSRKDSYGGALWGKYDIDQAQAAVDAAKQEVNALTLAQQKRVEEGLANAKVNPLDAAPFSRTGSRGGLHGIVELGTMTMGAPIPVRGKKGGSGKSAEDEFFENDFADALKQKQAAIEEDARLNKEAADGTAKALADSEKELTKIKKDAERDRLRVMEQGAAEERRINAQREQDMKAAGIAAGMAFTAALSEQLHNVKEGGEFNAGDFAKAILPLAVAAGVGVASGGASLPYSGLIAGGVGAITQLFADGGYVEGHAGGRYAGEGSAFDTQPAMLTPGERVLSLSEIARMGGRDGVERAVEGRVVGRSGGNVTVIKAEDALSFQAFMGTRGGTGFVNTVRQNRGEVAQLVRRLENA